MWQIFKFTNLLYILLSSYVWFSFYLPMRYLTPFISVVLILCISIGNLKVIVTKRALGLLGAIMALTLYNLIVDPTLFGLLQFFWYLPAFIVFILAKPLQKELLDWVSKWLSIILGIGAALYLVNFVHSLPYMMFEVPDNDFYQAFKNYIFFMTTTGYESVEAGVMRFGGPFLEPGHLSMVCGLILFANDYSLKKKPWLWSPLICMLISFSLVGYIILAISLLLLKITDARKMIAVVGLVLGSWVFCTQIWNEGQNPVNVLIFQRLEFDENKGIKGNNRTVRQTDKYFDQGLKKGWIITGVGANTEAGSKIRGAGFKIYLLRNGIIGALFILAIYILLISPRCNRRYAYSFLTLIILMFLQRGYPQWYSWLFFYTMGIAATVKTPPAIVTSVGKILYSVTKREEEEDCKRPESMIQE